MSHFLTVTLNPALDKTYALDYAPSVGELNRIPKPTVSAGGKSINSARMIRVMGGDVCALSFGGCDNGRDAFAGKAFEALLEREGLCTRIVPAACGVRTNVKLISPGGEGTELNESGGPVTPDEFAALMAAYEDGISVDCECVLLGGSIPQGVDKDVYNLMITMAKQRNIRVALDCDGAVFRQAVSARPWLVKPNMHELSQYYSTELSTIPQVIMCAKKFHVETGVNILCTAGGKGAVFVGNEGIFVISFPEVEVRGFAGAGDCTLGAFVYEYSRSGGDIVSSLKLGCGAGSAKAATVGTEMPSVGLVRELAERVSVERVVG